MDDKKCIQTLGIIKGSDPWKVLHVDRIIIKLILSDDIFAII
jgi:hypothetical protein